MRTVSWGVSSVLIGIVLAIGSTIAGFVDMRHELGPQKYRTVTRKGASFQQKAGAGLKVRFPRYTNWACGIGTALVWAGLLFDR